MKRIFLLLILWAGGWIAVQAQDRSALTGLVTDHQTGEPLPGASVEISYKSGAEAGAGKKKDIHLLTGLNGSFLLRHIAAGHYEVSVKYVGYERYAEEMDLSDGGAKSLTIGLVASQKELTTVNISAAGGRGSERSSVLADRRADILQNSLSARAIEISPDLSVANTAQRVSGVSLERSSNGEGQYVIIRGMDKRYIYTLVNGVKIPSPDNKNRYVPLDLFPADMLERLEISKSLTPNMEGDAIGGAVNMIMKDAPSKFSVNANAAVGYAGRFFKEDYTKFDHGPSLDRSPRDLNGPGYVATMKDFPNNAFSHSTSHNPLGLVAGVSLGGRLFNDRLGILVAGSFQNNYRNIHSINFGTKTSADGSAQLTDVNNRQYSAQQQRSGLHARLDYRLNDKNKINFYGAYLNLMRQETRRASDTSLELNRVGPGFGRVSNGYRDVYEVQQITHFTLKGEHALSRDLSLDWTASYSKAKVNRPDDATLIVNAGVQKDPVTGDKVPDPTNLQESSREFTYSTDRDKSGYLNLKYQQRIADIKIDWSAGGMYRDKQRSSSYDEYNLRPDPGGQIYNGDINQNHFIVFNGEGTSDDALNYNSAEKVGAAYAMAKIDIGKFLITGGARYEHTELSWFSYIPESAFGKTGDIKYYDVLPSGNIKYAFAKKQALRLSYYSAISRPNFYEVVPHVGGNIDEDYREKGNPNLKRTTADNLDLRYEYFPKGLDQLLAGVFYKRLKNPIEYALSDAGDPNDPLSTSTETYSIPSNFGTATNYGAELDLTKYWRWFGVKANYTFTQSSITSPKVQNFLIPGGTSSRTVDEKRSLQGQSKHIGNLSLLFKDDNHLGLNAQLAFGYTSRRINRVSQFYGNDIYQKGFEQLDFSVEKKLAHHWFIYAKVNNILNTPYELEQLQPYVGGAGANSAPFQTPGKNTFVRKDTYGANYLLGVKFKM